MSNMENVERKVYIAVDLGGTQIRAARYNAELELEERVATATKAQEGRDAVLDRVLEAIQAVVPEEGKGAVAAVGLGVPGPYNFKTGVLQFAPNMPGWEQTPLRSILADALDLPVFVGNDADVAALAEHRFGAGQGTADMIYLTISTGIGGGLIFDNRLFTGGNGLGGEVGHIAIDPTGPTGACGNTGCLEQMASGTAIGRVARERLRAGEASKILNLVDGKVDDVTAKEVNLAAQRGDKLAIEVFRQAGTYIGIAIVNLMMLLNPSLFVLGGSVTLAGDLLFGPIQETIGKRARESYRKHTRVVKAELGGDVGLMGALALCLMELGES